MSRESYAQTLLKRKMFELFGENAPQFILQLAIVLSERKTPDGKMITSLSDIWMEIFTNQTIVTSLYGIISRSLSIYLEMVSRDKYGIEGEPYTCFFNKVIAVPFIMAASIPRVL